MSSCDEYPERVAPATGWVGRILLAAIILVISEALNAIQGLAALFRDEAHWVTSGGSVTRFDITTWKRIHVVSGVLLIVVGLVHIRGSTFARVVGIV